MKILNPSDTNPKIKAETAKELVELAIKYGYQAAITVHVWTGLLDKEVVNENDAIESIQRLKFVFFKTTE